VSNPVGRPDLEIATNDEVESSPFAVPPPAAAPAPVVASVRAVAASPEPESWPYTLTSPERRKGNRRRAERRSPGSSPGPNDLIFDRRVMERRFGERRGH
jgi:hypothetical protein